MLVQRKSTFCFHPIFTDNFDSYVACIANEPFVLYTVIINCSPVTFHITRVSCTVTTTVVVLLCNTLGVRGLTLSTDELLPTIKCIRKMCNGFMCLPFKFLQTTEILAFVGSCNTYTVCILYITELILNRFKDLLLSG